MNSIPLIAQTADSEDEQALLQALATADADEARRLDRQLQRLWSRSGSPSMDLLLQRGRDALEQDDTAAAIEHLTALTDHAPEFAQGWSTRALAYFHAELYGPALLDLERSLALNPNDYNAIIGLGALLEEFGDKTRAYQAYTRAQAIHPHHEEVTRALDRLRPGIEGAAL
ncbi:hypothetical protein AB9K34_20080 [Sedimentitalea sp. XS_ASV28]